MPGEGGSGRVSLVPTVSMDMGPVPATPHSSSILFPTSSIITQLHHKRVRDIEVPVRKTSPLPVKQPDLKTDEEFQGGCPIIEENLDP